MKYLILKLGTSGVNPNANCIVQVFARYHDTSRDYKNDYYCMVKPHPKAVVEQSALTVQGTTLFNVQSCGVEQGEAFNNFKKWICGYVDLYDPNDKVILTGFNIAEFDCAFLRKWFALNDSTIYPNIFYNATLDCKTLTLERLLLNTDKLPKKIGFGEFLTAYGISSPFTDSDRAVDYWKIIDPISNVVSSSGIVKGKKGFDRDVEFENEWLN